MKSATFFTPSDLRQIQAQGLALEEVLGQIEVFQKGLAYLHLNRPCKLGDGIVSLSPSESERYAKLYEMIASSGRVMKFVPASGAATRMFQFLLEQYHHPDSGYEAEAVYLFFKELKNFAFYGDLRECIAGVGLDIDKLLREKKIEIILQFLFTDSGLNYAELPKGLIKFHRYPHQVRTAFEEHLIESRFYIQDQEKISRLHFTVALDHEAMVHNYFQKILPQYEAAGDKFQVSFSTQKPSTNTLAVDLANQPFRNSKGRLLFRPSGHGALLGNLDELQGDILFIKNIDNVVLDVFKEETCFYKKVLGGYLAELQDKTYSYLRILSQGEVANKILEEIFQFADSQFHISLPPRLGEKNNKVRQNFIFSKLNRPLRVCGMVKTQGEVGGGPFWVVEDDGSLSLQIVESSQMDLQSSEQQRIFQSSTHFNPVDLVCGVRDFRGRPFHLLDFSNPHTGFISQKSSEGRSLKALERPGLWNGGMAYWNTVFIEVPANTFSPVKSVMDLLRPEHLQRDH
jgi:uncharacterized protein DUF4301